MQKLTPDICILGAGSAGLSLAAGAAQLGASVVLVEAAKMGGDCLNYGCVPSKALLVAAKQAAALGQAKHFGVECESPKIDFARVHDHIHEVIASIAPHDSQERFEELGCTVLRGVGRFVSPRAVRVESPTEEIEIVARNFVIASGSSPLVPPIEGLRETPHLTNETVFDLRESPRSMIVLGGGPIGCEMGQAFARLGTKVHIVELATILPRDDGDAAEVVRQALRSDGIRLHEGRAAVRVARTTSGANGANGASGANGANGANGTGVAVTLADSAGVEETIEADVLLVALGRVANLDDLNLDAAGVKRGRAGVENNARLRTSNKRVWVAGDAAGRMQFTHVAGDHAGVLVRNLLFRIPAKVQERAIPWVTYTEPELAQVGLTEAAARDQGLKVSKAEWQFAENDRARAMRHEQGFVRVVVDDKKRVVGATIVGASAGELILPWVFAVGERRKLVRMTSAIAPYPTLSEASKRAAGSYFTPSLFSPKTRRLVRVLSRLP